MPGFLPENVATLAIDFSYLLVAFLFIMGLKAMSSPVTGNMGIRAGFHRNLFHTRAGIRR